MFLGMVEYSPISIWSIIVTSLVLVDEGRGLDLYRLYRGIVGRDYVE